MADSFRGRQSRTGGTFGGTFRTVWAESQSRVRTPVNDPIRGQTEHNFNFVSRCPVRVYPAFPLQVYISRGRWRREASNPDTEDEQQTEDEEGQESGDGDEMDS